MNGNSLKEKLEALLAERADTLEDALFARGEMLGALDALIAERFPAPEVDAIRAGETVLEVRDEATGRVYRRRVPLSYEENDNGIRLGGETADGRPVRIVFLSARAAGKIRDLTGKGADHDDCGTH